MKIILPLISILWLCSCNSLPLLAIVDSMQIELMAQQARVQAKANDYRKALATNQQVISLLEELHQTTQHGAIAAAHSRMASCHYRMGNYQKAIDADSSALIIRERLFGKKAYLTGNSYNNLATDYEELGLIRKSLDFQLLALKTRLIHKGKEHIKTARCYENLATTYLELHDYGRALQYCDETLAIYKQQLSAADPEMAGLYNNRGNIAIGMNNYESALADYFRAETIYLRQPVLDRLRFARLSNSIGSCYIKLGCLSDALKYLHQSIFIYDELGFDRPLGLESVHKNLSTVYQKQEDWVNANFHAKKALGIHIDAEKYNILEVVDAYENLAIISLDMQELNSAMTYLDSAQSVIYTSLTDKNDSEPYNLLNVELQSDRAEVYLQRYETYGQLSDLKQSLHFSLKSVELFEQYRLYNSSEQAKNVTNERILPIYERGIKAASLLSQQEPSQNYLDIVLDLIERSKSVVLQTSLAQVQTALSENLPASVTEQETAFQIQLSELEKQRYELKNKASIDTLALYQLQQKRFATQQAFHQWLDNLEQNYPKYFQIKYQTITTDVASIQCALVDDQSLIEYFVGEEEIYALVINKNEAHLRSWSCQQPLAALCLDFQQNIYSFNPYASPDNYAYNAFALYQQLIEPIASLLTQRIVIIPDKQIGYIPFAALLKSLPADKANFRVYDYLLHDYKFSYVHSSVIWRDLLERQTPNAKKNLLAIAPIFTDSQPVALASQRAQLGNLKYNTEESRTVIEHWGGELISGNMATKEYFLAVAAEYNFLHLATHGQANNVDGEYASLAFTGGEDIFLYLKEIYNLKLNTKMLVLSACETGTGPLRKGDGIVSLARGFMYAGVQSILTTLWKINDRTSVELMDEYYQQLLAKRTKDVALQQAQLHYIEEQPLHLTHPFYWAAYIPIGNMDQVQPSRATFFNWKNITLLTLGSFLLFWFLKNNQRITPSLKG
ncbi:MAG: CHAT domain-containing protein [Saprospiraceae bacterium]